MSNQIIGNIEYNSIKEKAYINGTQENLMQLAAELDKAGINYSGRISDYRSAITVETADRARTLEIMKGILNAAKENVPEDNSEKNIIGNAEYRYISNKRYIRGETEAMLRTADRLTAENISFSGRIKGDTVTLTVSGDETQELVKRYFAEEKNRIENVQSAYFLALSSDTFEDGYYFSEVNTATGEEIAPYRSSFGDISMFVSVDSAVRYAEGAGITLSNTDDQLNEWRRIEAEAEAEKDRQLNLSRSREIIKRLPMTEKGEYEEHFVLREDAIDWIYFNPDGADGEGQFIQTSLYAEDFIAAFNARSNADNSQSAFIEAIQNGKQTIINADTEEFERLADTFIKSRSNENVIVSAPVVSDNRYSNSFERIINLLENHFEDVRKYKENHITEASENISVEGHIGTWYVIAAEEIEGRKLFLLEHEKYGDEAANIIIDENKNLVMEDVWNGFDDYRDSLEYDDGKQFVSRDFAVELWQNGFTVFMNERSNELASRKNDPKGFDLFLDENSNNFYAFNKDIVQQRLLDDTVTLLDGLNDAAIIEAGENNKQIDTAENYARNMFDDGDCAYRWNEGITEWQNISASILSGNTEYIYAWLNDLPLELPYLEENQDVSITNALKYLDNYEKEYMGKLSIDEMKKGTRLVYNNTNWEVIHVNNNVLALKNLDSNNEMSSTIIERWQNVVTRNKVKFIEEKENSPLENNSQEAAENNSKKTLIINAFGGPGAGKSTACLHITSELKKRGFVAEYVPEYAKELVWDKNFEMLDGSERHQKMILEEQKKRMDRLIGQVDFVVSDAPILLNSVYLNSDDKHSYDEALVNLFNQYDNFNLEVIRDVNNFEEEGRIHNLEQSQQADNDIRTLLNRNNIYFGTYSHGNLDKIVDNAVVTYNKLSSKTIVIPEIPSRLSVISPVGKYVPDENLPLSKQLYELAKRELADYENNLDTAEKAKAAAYELSVKRDILSYIEYDLAEDITDPDVETACRRLISSGYPLDTFYQDWLKNEYDNRMEAIRMTAADTFRKENEHIGFKYNGYHFIPTGKINSKTSLKEIGNLILTNNNLGMSAYKGSRLPYSYDEFYLAAQRSEADVFRCIEDGKYYLPGTNELFEYIGEFTALTAEKQIETSERIIPTKNFEFTVITFEDGSVYAEAGKIDDNNVNSTAAYADMMKNNFDIDKMEDLDESIKVEYAVYHTGDGEAVMPTDEELAEIRDSLDDFIGNKEPISTEASALFPWTNGEDILYDLDMFWREKSDFSNVFEYQMDTLLNLVPTENLSPIAVTEGGIKHYDTLSAVTQIKLKGSDWLDTFDAAVEMNRRGIDIDDVELLRTTLAFDNGNYTQKEITPEQFAAYRKKIDDDPSKYEDVILNYRNFKAEKEKDFAQAQEDLEDNLAKVLYYSVASDELENISKVIFTDDTDKKIEIAKEYLDSNFTYGKYTDILIQKSDNDVRFSLANGFTKSGFEITYNWTEIAAAYEQAALNDMEWYYTSGRVLEVYKQTLEKDTAVGGNLDVQLDRAVFTDWVSDIIARQNSVKTAYEANDKALFEGTVRREVDIYFYMLCEKSESIGGYNLKDISDFVNAFCGSSGLRKDIYAVVTENVDISLGIIEKARETAHNAGLPFREAVADPEEEFNPYAFDGTMSPEDYDLMHKHMREDSFEIYQVKSGEEYHDKRFAGLSELSGTPNVADYDLVYSGKLSEINVSAENKNEILESIFTKFNTDRPEDFKGHSLSVSDVVVLHKDNTDTAHYVDTLGFNDVPEFLKEKTNTLQKSAFDTAVELINEYAEREFGETANFSNTDHVDLAYTTHEITELPIEVYTDLDTFRIVTEYDGKLAEEKTFDSLEDMNVALANLDFHELVYVSDDVIDRLTDKDKNTSPVGNLEEERHISATDITIGDRFLYKGEEVTVSTLKGIYPDDVGIGKVKRTGLIDFEFIRSVDRFTLAKDGIYLGNAEKAKSEEKTEYTDEPISQKENLSAEDNSSMGTNKALERAKKLINKFCDKEYGSTGDFSDLHNVSLAYTTLTDDELPIQVTADLVDFKITFELNGEKYNEEKYNSLEDLIDYELSNLDFDELVYVPDRVLEKYMSGGKSNELMNDFSEAVEKVLKTVTNQYNSFLLVQDVVYSLRDLQDGYADDYDWKNYAKAFKNVLDSNVHTEIALPLYKSEAYEILSAAAERKEISADDIAKALKNLELVLQNSHLLKNPEEKVEQISFFDSTPSRKSSDEIGYVSEVPQNEKEPSPVGNNSQEEISENENVADYTITDKNYGTEGGAKARFTNNVAAIKLLKTLEKENRTATPEEQEVLAKYVGWGGIANAFDSRKPDWSKEYTELKGLLTDEEYRAARASTMNAHYTTPTVIKAIYSGLDNLGFKGGKILEPAMGIGNFFGAMPENIRANSDLHGVELDSITGRIAQQLYPSANIQIKGYEDTSFENGSFDVAVGNVPFGGYKLNDKDYNKQNLLIHDYFFAKTLDKVRAGGIVAFVTSKGTLDKESPEVRKYLAERAELLGAIRLPNNAFKANAGTEVTSDIIFLQKRERPISIEEDTPEWVYKDMLPNGIAVNKYFADHPEMILGEMVEGNKLYGNQTDASMCIPIEGADLEKQLAEAVKNITGEYKAAEKEMTESPVGNTDEIPCPPNAPKYSFIVQDDILYYHKASDTMEKYNAPETSIEKIKAMVQLRDSVHSLLDLQLNNTDGRFDTAISEAQSALNKQYDNFYENYGLISNAENKMLFRNDNSYHLIKSLEKLDKDGNFIGKADIFSKITVNPNVVVDHCDNAQDALILSLSEKMCVNLEYMSILTGKSEEEIVSELGDKIFQNPQKYMRWESADEYLTGNIRSKLAAAEAAGLTRNAEALRAVMPERIEAADIAVKLGAAWIDPDYIRQFIIETLKPDYITSKNIEVTYMPATDKWKIEGWRSAYNNVLATETYGTFDMNAYEIIEATLNMQKAEIRQRVKDERGNDLRDSKGRYVYETDPKRTMIVQAKQDELKRKFADWIFSDPDRREKLVDVYNEKFNSVRLREYDGSHLNFVGMSSAITLKEHQKNAVARGLYSNGNTLLAHEVGAGKTFEMIAIAMEGKRLGLHNKSLITAPNGLTEQWGNAFRTLYPNANVLVATEKDFQKENRRDLFAKIATGDWDAVIIGHSQFDMIHLSRERELDVLNTELDRLEEALREMDDGVGRKSFSVKQIEKAIKTYEDKIEKLLAKSPEDDMLCFEKLGIDKIFVDESQAYKNLDTPTKMRNVSGIGSGGSGRSMQLLMKCKYLDELTGGKGTVFASGTPISNSMSEMYTLMRYLQADKLAELGINSFDRWASVFGETTTSMELSPEGNGKYQMKTRFAKFQNLPELMNIFKECADIKTAESLDLDRPDFEMHNVNVPATAIQATMIKELGERAKEIRAGHIDPTDDNMCKLTVDGRKIGLDQRCMNPNLPDDPKSKVNVCINNVFDIWQRTAEEKSTQLIFCDLATPQPTLNENTYTVYRKNTKGGYSDVYSAKLGEKDTAEKIMKKLNGKKPPKNYEAGDVSDGDIIMLKRVNYEEETAYNTAFEVVDGKLTEIAPETWEKLKHKPVEQFESERKFCVYDDIKQKLIAKGVPEKEIAFIHDVDKAEEKQKLYDKMNKGEIRVLIGSTFKCGAGMNAQERMIALHDLDAPMRPSDMEQRHGRIIRQGNTNSKVDIYRYTTDKTFDAYLYQMLENKQRFISQIMTDKSPVRSCEDVDEIALDYAEVKALCAGNPLIREKIDLETEITKLNVLKSAFLSQKYSLQDKAYKSLPEHRKHTERYIGQLKADIETVQSIKPFVNEDGKNYYPVTVGGKEYHDKEEAGQAIRKAVVSNDDIMHGRERVIGSYRGLEMSILLNGTTVKVNLEGATSHYGELNLNQDVKASGNIIRLDNVINNMALELQKQEDRLQSLNADIKEAEIAAEAVFPQEQELIQKEKRLAEVNTLLTDSEIRTDNSMELYAALVEICPELEQYDNLSCKYEKGEDSGIEPLIVEKQGDTVFIAHTYVQNGDLMYDPAIEFSLDTKNHRAEALSYELSGMGIYENFRDGERPDQKADVEEMALDTMFENIKAYGYERTKFNVDDDREAEKEIRGDFAR